MHLVNNAHLIIFYQLGVTIYMYMNSKDVDKIIFLIPKVGHLDHVPSMDKIPILEIMNT